MTQEDRSKLPLMETQRSILGWVKCPGCGTSFKFSDRRAWTGNRHSPCGQKLVITNVIRQAEPIWCVIANVSDQIPYGEDGEIRRGTRHFSAGARVYCFPPLWGDGYENIKVIGRHRGSVRFVEMVLPSKCLVDCRAKLVYGPFVLDRLSGHWDGTERSKQLARELADTVNSRNAERDRVMKPRLKVMFSPEEFAIAKLDATAWSRATPVAIDLYWNGDKAPEGRRASVRLLWSGKFLYLRFDCRQAEPLILNPDPQTSQKTMQLWDSDVCEIFLAPDPKQPRKYLEFEAAPTGEWIDLAIDFTGPKRETDWDFKSGMESAAKIEKDEVVMAMKIPWSAFGATPKAGDVWLGNLFRCVGRDPDRGYLAWSPTMTEEPNFHVPEKFGEFEFEK